MCVCVCVCVCILLFPHILLCPTNSRASTGGVTEKRRVKTEYQSFLQDVSKGLTDRVDQLSPWRRSASLAPSMKKFGLATDTAGTPTPRRQLSKQFAMESGVHSQFVRCERRRRRSRMAGGGGQENGLTDTRCDGDGEGEGKEQKLGRVEAESEEEKASPG
jgi:hypothetical protein